MFLLDTNLVSELRKAPSGRANPRVVTWAANEPPEGLFLSAISVLELELGILLKERRDPDRGGASGPGWSTRYCPGSMIASCRWTRRSPAAARRSTSRTHAPSEMP